MLFPNEYESYNEGIISDVLDGLESDNPSVVNNTRDGAISRLDSIDKGLSSHEVDTRSIVSRARNSIMYFPVYISQSSSVKAAHIVSELFARVYTTLVQVSISQNPIIDEDEVNDMKFLRKFHTNLKESVGIEILNEYYKPIDDIDRMMEEAIFYRENITENMYVEFSVDASNDMDLIRENARLINEPLSGFKYLKEAERNEENTIENNSMTKIETVSDEDFFNMAANELDIDSENMRMIRMNDEDVRKNVLRDMFQSKPVRPGENASDDEINAFNDAMRDYNNEINNRINDIKNLRNDVYDKVDEIKSSIKNGTYSNSDYSYRNGKFLHMYTQTSGNKITSKRINPNSLAPAMDAPAILKESDIKKENAMLPYTIKATFHVRTKGNQFDRLVQYVLGVKAILHLIRVQDLADDLHEIVTGNIKSLQKIRYKTGEITSKDYFLNLSGLKKDASKRINYNKRWINTLKQNAEWAKLHGSVFNGMGKFIHGNAEISIPNGTLVLTQADVITLVNQTGIDLSEVQNVIRLASSLFLIAVAILDISAGSMRVLFPNEESDWSVYSLANVESEISKTDNSALMSELNKIVNKGGK